MSSDVLHSIRSLAAVALLLFVASCSEETPSEPNDSKTPRNGSSYRFHRYNADTLGHELPGSGDTATTTLVAVNAQHVGHSGVHVFTQLNDTVARLHYEESGDVQYYPKWAGLVGAGWITLPVESKGTTEHTLRDTTIDLGGGHTGRNSVTLSVKYMSPEQVVVNSETITAHKIQMRIVEVHPISAEQNLTNTTTHTVWYAPKNGYFVRQETGRTQESPYSTDVFETAVHVLTAYELK